MKPEDYAKTSEHSHQVALFIWAHSMRDTYPELKWLHAIHNQGHGDAVRGGKAKAEGVRAGVFDVCLPVGRAGYFGLYIEMKAPGKVMNTSPDQEEFGKFILSQGYAAMVCDHWQAASRNIRHYLDSVETIKPNGYPSDIFRMIGAT